MAGKCKVNFLVNGKTVKPLIHVSGQFKGLIATIFLKALLVNVN